MSHLIHAALACENHPLPRQYRILLATRQVVGGLRFTAILLCSFLFFIRQLPSELAERNSTKTCHMLRSECVLKAHVRNPGYPSPKNRGPKNHLFSTTSQLNGNFNGLYLRSQKRYTHVHWKLQWVSYIVSNVMTWSLVHKRLKIAPP